VDRIKAHTVPGGFNAYTCMLFTEEYPAPPEFQHASFKHSLDQYELAGRYGDWDLIRHDRYVKWDQHPGIPIHCHPVDKVVARRPGGVGPSARIEPVPIGTVDMPRAAFDTIDMGLPVDELLARCGEPAVIDRVTMGGIQLGVGPESTVEAYELSLWYYGRAVMYVINGRVWGRALYQSVPMRVSFPR
jgi:tellurite methyltransferase